MSVPSTLSLIVSVYVFESHPKLLITVHIPLRNCSIPSAFCVTVTLKEYWSNRDTGWLKYFYYEKCVKVGTETGVK